MTEAFNPGNPRPGAEEPDEGAPVVKDRRRIDPETGEVREPRRAAAAPADPADSAGAAAEAAPEDGGLEAELAERTADLQRLQAEFVNYKRRVDRDRAAVRESSVGTVLTALLPVLDDIDRARDHGELEGGFKAVADSMERILGGLGLVRYGEPGDEFDPQIHEAMMHAHSDEVDRPTCQVVLQPGYRIGERVLRAARVSVVEPGGETAAEAGVPADDDS